MNAEKPGFPFSSGCPALSAAMDHVRGFQWEHARVPGSQKTGIAGTIIKGVADDSGVTPLREIGHRHDGITVQDHKGMIPGTSKYGKVFDRLDTLCLEMVEGYRGKFRAVAGICIPGQLFHLVDVILADQPALVQSASLSALDLRIDPGGKFLRDIERIADPSAGGIQTAITNRASHVCNRRFGGRHIFRKHHLEHPRAFCLGEILVPLKQQVKKNIG